jgi:hypothetical protein
MYSKDQPFSYHTFIFPFVWNDDGTIERDDFEKVLAGEHWHKQEFAYDGMPKKEPQQTPEEYEKVTGDWYRYYKKYQFFNKPARELLFDTPYDHGTQTDQLKMSTFEFRPSGSSIRNKARYKIMKDNECFDLSINAIKLNIYDTGSAVILFELEYSGDRYIQGVRDQENGCSLDSINKINEYGRRVNFPYLQQKGYPGLMADTIVINLGIDKLPSIIENYRGWHMGSKEDFPLTYIYNPICELLHFGSNDDAYKVTSSKKVKTEKGGFYIYPLIDDRMFVCCLLTNSKLLGPFNNRQGQQKEYLYLTDCDEDGFGISTELYKFAFIETSATCHSHALRKQILKDSVYDRWIEYGTVYAATHHSFVCALSPDEETGYPDDYLIENFLGLYIKLCIIALLQRVTMLALSEEASALSAKLQSGHDSSPEDLEDIRKLYEKYARAESQIMLTEVTPQEQGVELYKLIVKQLYIDESKDDLDKKLNNLYTASNIINNMLERKADYKLQDQIKILTELGLVLAAFGIIFGLADVIFALQGCWWLVWLAVLLGLIVSFVIILWKLWRKFWRKLGPQKDIETGCFM